MLLRCAEGGWLPPQADAALHTAVGKGDLATSDRIDVVRARLADRGVNSSTHGTVVNDAAIEEELKAQWARRPRGHVGRTVNQLMNRTERSEEAQAAQRRL